MDIQRSLRNVSTLLHAGSTIMPMARRAESAAPSCQPTHVAAMIPRKISGRPAR